ncbi:MAG: 30S ribosomal protein S8 [Deltaproteobacteria bacterium]|nr:30S ribosomal protein S8 [Deltaproteobacteria bacterium]
MSMSDPIADMLTRVRNAIMVSYDTVDIPISKLKVNIAKILKSEGFIKNYKIMDSRRKGIIRVFLKYDENGDSIIGGLKRVSKPSCRIYKRSDSIPRVLNGFGINILSTSTGVMTDKQARKMGVGGEILCSVW